MVYENDDHIRESFRQNIHDEMLGLELRKAEINGDLLTLHETLRCFGYDPDYLSPQFFRGWMEEIRLTPPKLDTNVTANQVINIWSLYDDMPN